MLFDNLQSLIRVVAISILAYGALVIVLRVTGERAHRRKRRARLRLSPSPRRCRPIPLSL
jgi:hypothetical protein